MEFQLTKDQQKCFNAIEGSDANVLVHGKPGVGKSVLIRALVDEEGGSRKTYALAAPTGLAALNIGGRTLHSIFRLPVSEGIIDPSFNKFPNDDRVIWAIRNIKALIIDEVSMVRADSFDYIDRLMRYAKGNSLPFGGVQLIAIGDFYQLPPVVTRDEVPQLRNAGFSSPFIFSSKVFQGNFNTLILDEVLRQKGDLTFIKLLNSARTGEVTAAQMATLNKHVGLPDDIRIKLAGTNKQAEFINDSELAKINSPAIQFEAQKFGEWPADPVSQLLTLKVGAQVMVKMNGADRPNGVRGEFKSRVVNGTLGKVVEIIDKPAKHIRGLEEAEVDAIQKVVIQTDSGELIPIYRKRWERKIKEPNGNDWEERVIASYEQIPLALAWAISIHKSQGQSFDKVHIDAEKIFAPGQLYVALSRCRSLAGLSLQSKVTTNKFWANRDVIRFFNEVETV